ncbi:MBL fold metallo-hydrolase [Streptomyces otsuchiensis]|uniref:MBL fold metallo-hydrolase n=1 Tax=Streptomyces otsuchiensis TaxID=2681388 RepID=UPI00103114E7|nr:MBL fold metallo-hydrolase [Streptomyces otsuchiensis]
MERTWEDLGPGVVRRRLPGWDETVGAVAGEDAVLVVDTGAATTDALRRRLSEMFRPPVRHVVITHPHFDHILGTGGFPDARTYGAVGLGALLAGGGREALAEDAVRHGAAPGPAHAAAAALHRPDHEVSGELVVELGGRRVVLVNVGPGHTGHDLAVLVPDAGVVFCGDLVEESGEPQAGPDAHPAWWPAALDRLLALGGEDAAYVPGHGAVVDAAFVRAQRTSLARRFGEDTGHADGHAHRPGAGGAT